MQRSNWITQPDGSLVPPASEAYQIAVQEMEAGLRVKVARFEHYEHRGFRPGKRRSGNVRTTVVACQVIMLLTFPICGFQIEFPEPS